MGCPFKPFAASPASACMRVAGWHPSRRWASCGLTKTLPCSQVSMTYIEKYTLPYLCCLGLGFIVLVYMAAAVLTIILLRLLFVPQTVAACMQGVLPGA